MLSLPKVAILLCTYNGEKFLPEQLDSFESQDYSDWQVWASDDGSKDSTLAILERYRIQWGDERLSIITGPGKGSTANFLSLTCKSEINADFYAFSDQDDIWENDKLSTAVNWLNTVSNDTPALYCARTRLVDAVNQEIGFSQFFKNPPSFANALVQNIAGGNTMVINKAACDLIREMGKDVDVVVHDWWFYMLVSGCGGRIFYDGYTSLRYRQHNENQIGMNSNWSARWARIRMLLQGQYSRWNDRNILALQQFKHRLTVGNLLIFNQFCNARKLPLIPRLCGFKQSGIYRQTLLGNLGLVFAAIVKKI